MRLVITLFLLLGSFAALVLAWWRGRLWVALLAVILALASMWGLAFVATWTDYRDADGWVDCWPACTLLQDGVGTVLVLGPLVIAASLLLALVLAAVTLLRGRSSRRV